PATAPAASAPASEPESAPASRPIEPWCYPARGGVTVDGDLSEWDRRGALVLGERWQLNRFAGSAVSTEWTGRDDASATIYLAYDARDLFVAGEVVDDRRAYEDQLWWDGDCIELFLDVRRGGDASPDASGSGAYQICLMPFNAGRRWGVARRGRAIEMNDG